MKHTITQIFSDIKRNGEIAFIPYLMAGFPTMDRMQHYLLSLLRAGADIIEVGIPFTDPIADGSVIQYASQRALSLGTTLQKVFKAVGELSIEVPLILMSYCNPLLAYGKERLFSDMQDAGFSGIIIPDLPPEESGPLVTPARGGGIEPIFLAAPTSSNERLALVADRSQGFVYCVSTTGTTGVRNEFDPSIFDFLKRVRGCTDKAIAVGFGISTPEQVRTLRRHIDGVVVGSRLIEAIEKGEDMESLASELKEATRDFAEEYGRA